MDKHQFLHVARQVYNAYLDASRKPQGYLLLDLAQDIDERLRFRTHIFPDEKTVLFSIPSTDCKSNETIQLSHSTRA
jgi:hypothetical protein